MQWDGFKNHRWFILLLQLKQRPFFGLEINNNFEVVASHYPFHTANSVLLKLVLSSEPTNARMELSEAASIFYTHIRTRTSKRVDNEELPEKVLGEVGANQKWSLSSQYININTRYAMWMVLSNGFATGTRGTSAHSTKLSLAQSNYQGMGLAKTGVAQQWQQKQKHQKKVHQHSLLARLSRPDAASSHLNSIIRS